MKNKKIQGENIVNKDCILWPVSQILATLKRILGLKSYMNLNYEDSANYGHGFSLRKSLSFSFHLSEPMLAVSAERYASLECLPIQASTCYPPLHFLTLLKMIKN